MQSSPLVWRSRAAPFLTAAAALRMLSHHQLRHSSNFSSRVLSAMKPSTEALKPSSAPLPLTRHPLSISPNSFYNCFSTASAAPSVPGALASGSGGSGPSSLVVVSFYKFADFPDHAELRKPLKDLCEELRVSGGIILAPEGINGSLCGTRDSVENILQFIQSDGRLRGLRRIESPVTPEDEAIHHGHTCSSPVGAGEDAPFRWDHVRVKLKQEIVSLGMPSVKPTEKVGKYVQPREWNELISDPDTVVVDVRNTYEIRVGKFQRAVDPKTTAFREFPTWVENELVADSGDQASMTSDSVRGKEENTDEQEHKPLPRVAMYCTGGIRCEKASSYLLSKGFKEVYHLQGGILKYLEEVPKSESLWEGECFVFDKRVSVDHGLVPGSYKLCYGCKQPVSDEDMESPLWELGVTCPYCFSSKSEEEKDRARARQRQFQTWGVIGGPDKGRRPTKQSVNGIQTPESSRANSLHNWTRKAQLNLE